jgi:hypothetical protein
LVCATIPLAISPTPEVKSNPAWQRRKDLTHVEVFCHAHAGTQQGTWRKSGDSQITSTKLNGVYGRPELLEAA